MLFWKGNCLNEFYFLSFCWIFIIVKWHYGASPILNLIVPQMCKRLNVVNDEYIVRINQNQASHWNSCHYNPCQPNTPGNHTLSMKLTIHFLPKYHYFCIAYNVCDKILHKLHIYLNPIFISIHLMMLLTNIWFLVIYYCIMSHHKKSQKTNKTTTKNNLSSLKQE